MTYLIIILAINIIISMVISNTAKHREISPTSAFFISFLLSPIIGMFVVAMSPQKQHKEEIEEIQFEEPKEDNFLSLIKKYWIYAFVAYVAFVVLYQIVMF